MRYPELTDSVVAVTGAGSNIGRAIALAFAEQGAKVVVCDVDRSSSEQTRQLIVDQGGQATVALADMSKAADVEKAVAQAIAQYGRIDVWINNAGITQSGRSHLSDVTEEQFDRIIAVNLKSVWLGMKCVIPQMLAQGAGSIVNVSSVRGFSGAAGGSIYSASKHGIIGLTKSAALEYGPRGIRINAACPGQQDGAMINPSAKDVADRAANALRMNPATGRPGRADEVAWAVLFLCSAGASNIHGVSLPIDGGFSAQ